MSETSESGESTPHQPATVFPFVNQPLRPHGPETIVHPERRGVSDAPPMTPSSADSRVWNRLFPPEVQQPQESVPESPAGCRFRHFVIEERIGYGGMGAVFRAVDERLDREVALKVLSPVQSRDSSSVRRFQNEAKAAAQLDHDNIARVFYVGEDHGLHFIAFEFVTGTNIRDLIHEKGQFDPAEAVNYTLQIATALNHTSAAGVVHRDIKPSNIIITPHGRAKVVDLGLARKKQSESVGELTVAGTTLGTFDYISPEQAKDPRNVDVRSDIYSLGCTLYHMLTGGPPYPEGTVLQKLLDHQGKEPPNPAEKNRKVSPQLASVVLKMMASDPDLRYHRPDDLIHDLMIVAAAMGLRGVNPEGLIWSAPKIDRPRFWERNLGWIATAAALILIVSLLEFVPHFRRETASSDPQNSNGNASEGKVASLDQSPAGNSSDGQPILNRSTKQRGAKSTDLHKSGNINPNLSSVGPPENPAHQAVRPNIGIRPPRLGSVGKSAVVPDDDNILKIDDENPRVPFNDPKLQIVPGISDSTSKNPKPNEIPKKPSRNPESNSPDVHFPIAALKPTKTPILKNRRNITETISRPFASGIKKQPAISIITTDGTDSVSYRTLEAACRAAKDDDIIVLNYNGRRSKRSERPLRIENKKITIRAGKNTYGKKFRPVIEFDADDRRLDDETRMITVIGGSVEFINVDIHISLPQYSEVDQWSLFSLDAADRVRLRGVNLTFLNPKSHVAAVFELRSSLPIGDMKMPKASQAGTIKEFGIEVIDSFVRGNCDMFSVRHTRPGRFRIENSVLAIESSLLANSGDLDTPSENADLELQLEHVTCIVGNSLIRLESGDEGRNQLPVSVTAHNSILATNTAGPLVKMTGNTYAEDFRERLQWEGGRNVYNGFETYWVISPTQVTAGKDEYDFEQWVKTWQCDTDVEARQSDDVWRKGSWQSKKFAEISKADLWILDDPQHPVLPRATDGHIVGADLTKLGPPEQSDSDVE